MHSAPLGEMVRMPQALVSPPPGTSRTFGLPFWLRLVGMIMGGAGFDCRLVTALMTPVQERCGGLRRPGGPQSNRQFLPVVLGHEYAVRRLNTGGCDPVVGFIPAVNGEAFSSTFRNSRRR